MLSPLQGEQPKSRDWEQLAELHLEGICKGIITPLGIIAIDLAPEELAE